MAYFARISRIVSIMLEKPPGCSFVPDSTHCLTSSGIDTATISEFSRVSLSIHFSVMCCSGFTPFSAMRSEEHTSELQSQFHLVCRLLLEKKKKKNQTKTAHTETNSTS